jgi:hypothetical protein
MFRRILGILLSICCIVTALPAIAQAPSADQLFEKQQYTTYLQVVTAETPAVSATKAPSLLFVARYAIALEKQHAWTGEWYRKVKEQLLTSTKATEQLQAFRALLANDLTVLDTIFGYNPPSRKEVEPVIQAFRAHGYPHQATLLLVLSQLGKIGMGLDVAAHPLHPRFAHPS